MRPLRRFATLFGLFAPEGTPRPTVDALNTACARVLAQPAFRQVLAAAGNMPATGSSR